MSNLLITDNYNIINLLGVNGMFSRALLLTTLKDATIEVQKYEVDSYGRLTCPSLWNLTQKEYKNYIISKSRYGKVVTITNGTVDIHIEAYNSATLVIDTREVEMCITKSRINYNVPYAIQDNELVDVVRDHVTEIAKEEPKTEFFFFFSYYMYNNTGQKIGYNSAIGTIGKDATFEDIFSELLGKAKESMPKTANIHIVALNKF